MQCKQIKKNGDRCKNHSAYGCKTCRYHGARKITYGSKAPNYKHGEYTKEAKESRERLRALSDIGNYVGMFNRKMVGRRPKNTLIDDVERFKKLFKELDHEIFNKQDN